jgi:hypothetical protein
MPAECGPGKARSLHMVRKLNTVQVPILQSRPGPASALELALFDVWHQDQQEQIAKFSLSTGEI